jgi:predicted amidohydrolase YtcJ
MGEPSFLQRLKERKLVQWAVVRLGQVKKGGIMFSRAKRIQFVGLIACVLSSACSQSEIPDVAELVLTNGKIVTVDGNERIAEAVAVMNGRIAAVGTNDDVKAWTGAATNVIDLQGRTAIPGLIDSHAHITSTALRRVGVLDLSEEAGIGSIADIQKTIAERATGLPQGEWIIGVGEDDYKLAEKRHPTRWELDEASPDHAVMISTVGGHFSIANSKAFVLAGVTKDTPDPVGGMFDRDPATGELTGGLHEGAVGIVRRAQPPREALSREEAAEAVKNMMLENARTGLTTIYDNVGSRQVRAVLDLKSRGELPIRFRVDLGVGLHTEMRELGLIHEPFGDEWVKICGVKFFFDGAISARTAAVSEPYLHRESFYGVMATTEELARNTLRQAYEAGMRVSAHANGDKAISMYLDIMEELQRTHPREDPRNRIVHCTVIDRHLVERIRELEMLPTIFGAYPYYHGDKLIPAFGEERLQRMFAARSFLDAGVKVAAHSDHSASPFAPLMGIHALVNRTTKAGKPIGQDQRVSVMEALKLYTIHAAYHSFDEDLLGSIETGKCADIVVLGEDILTVSPERIVDIPIDMTIVDGKVVYERRASG